MVYRVFKSGHGLNRESLRDTWWEEANVLGHHGLRQASSEGHMVWVLFACSERLMVCMCSEAASGMRDT